MKVLVACEFSGIVRDAFLKRGHEAMSCDLLPTESPGPHHQGDIREVIHDYWDMMIAFPPCTHLASSGAVYWPEKQKDGRQQKAIFFFKLFLSIYGIKKVAVENPAGIISTVWRKPDQYIHPYQFGDPYMKRTGLWLKDLPILRSTNIVEPIARWHGGSTRGGIKKDGTRTKSNLPALHKDSKKRSITFKGIAEAMAEQWG